MESQIQQAVEIALLATLDPQLKQQAMEYCEEVKQLEAGYQAAVVMLQKPMPLVHVQFFVYQVIEGQITQLGPDPTTKLYQELTSHMAAQVDSSDDVPTYLKNKLALLFAKVFCHGYLGPLPHFLQDWLVLFRSQKQRAVDYYTRVMLAIHYEIGDKWVIKLRQDQEMANLLKDQIRNQDMESLVALWHQIISDGPDRWLIDVIQTTLDLIGAYVLWMEITLFIKPEVVTTIFRYLGIASVRNACCQCVTEIVAKKMKPEAKLQLVALLDLALTLNLIGVADNEDVTFMENLGRLINQMGVELVGCVDQLNNLIGEVEPHLYKVWPLVFFLLGHEYDDVALQVFSFIQAYLVLAKKNPQLQDRALLSQLLNKVVLKMKYDDDSDGDDDDDGLFAEVRTKLKTFQDLIAVISPDLYVEAIPVIVQELIFALPPDASADWRKIELGLYELANFGDLLRTNIIGVPKPEISSLPPYHVYREFMIRLIHLDHVMAVRHPLIQLGFFDLLVKQFFFVNPLAAEKPLIITRVLEIFLSPVAVFSDDEKVRLRLWYCLFRFLKQTKPSGIAVAFVEEMVLKLQPLLKIEATVMPPVEDGTVVTANLTFSGQLYLMELIGMLTAMLAPRDLDAKLALLNHIFAPIMVDLEAAVARGDDLASIQAHYDIMAIGTVAKGFDDGHGDAGVAEAVVAKFNEVASAIIITLETMPKSKVVRDAARFAFSRLVPIAGATINPQLSKLVTVIVGAPNLELLELLDFLLFLGQLVHVHKQNPQLYSLLNNVLGPILRKVFSMVELQLDDALIADMQRDKLTLKRLVVGLLLALVINHQTLLLVLAANQNDFPQVLGKLFDFAYDIQDSVTSKMAVIQLTNIVSLFGQGRLDDNEDPGASLLSPLDGIDTFLMERVTKLLFEMPFSQQFDANDAQHRLVAKEVASLLKAFADKRQDDFMGYLRQYLATMGLADDYTEDLCVNLVKNDSKGFKTYFVTFIRQLK